jgi:hypothetical protein
MSDSNSDDDLRPHEQRRSRFENPIFSVSDDNPDVRDYELDACLFASSLCSSPQEGIHNDCDDSSTGSDDAPPHGWPSNSGSCESHLAAEVPVNLPLKERADLGNLSAPRAGRSIADHLINDRECCIQLSAEFCTIKLKEPAKGTTKDTLEDLGKHSDTFNT